jgi:hypothetical protein
VGTISCGSEASSNKCDEGNMERKLSSSSSSVTSHMAKIAHDQINNYDV